MKFDRTRVPDHSARNQGRSNHKGTPGKKRRREEASVIATVWRVIGTLTPRGRWLWLSLALFAVVITVAIIFWTELDWTKLHEALQRVPAVVAITLMSLLPLAGFSVAIIYAVAGARFGLLGGGVVVVGITIVHLLGSYWIARGFLGKPLARFMARRNHSLPRVTAGAHVSVAAIAALMPGIPYFIRNYLLPLSGIPLRVYFWICLPIYVARSYVTIFLGDLSGELSVNRVLVLGAVLAVKLTICGMLLAHLRLRVGSSFASGLAIIPDTQPEAGLSMRPRAHPPQR